MSAGIPGILSLLCETVKDVEVHGTANGCELDGTLLIEFESGRFLEVWGTGTGLLFVHMGKPGEPPQRVAP